MWKTAVAPQGRDGGGRRDCGKATVRPRGGTAENARVSELCFSVTLHRGGSVTTAVDTPDGFRPGATPVVVLGHGAGNDMRSGFLEYFATALSARGLAVVRFNFPYKEAPGQRPPDRMDVLVDTYREVVAASAKRTGSPPGPLFVGGKSMGGRVASMLCAEKLVTPSGLVFLGYPLHAPGKTEMRSEHLAKIGRPMLFVQGMRDPFGTVDEIRAERKRLKLPGALHVVDGGDHSFALLKSQQAKQHATMDAAADAIVAFVKKVLAR
jgi:predicted alpha/beta-hydrolase family hydrolase